MTDSNQATPETNLSLSANIEALLFVAPGAISTSQLATALGTTTTQIENSLQELAELYQERGLRLQRDGNRVQLTTAPETAVLIEHYLGLEATSKLSRAALEALAIIVYQQPVTRPQVDSIRGVNSDGVMKTLLSKGLIQEIGRAEGPGRPILYSTTPDFLGYFGLGSLEELPPLNLEDLFAEDESNGENGSANGLLKD